MRAAEFYARISRRSLSVAQRYAAAYADANRNSLVVITRNYTFNEDKAFYDRSAPPRVIYDDSDHPGIGAPAGITPTSGPAVMDFSDEPTSYDSVQIYLPLSMAEEPRIDDIVLVTSCPDTTTVGRYFRVTSVPAGGRINSSIDIIATGIAPSKEA